MQGSQMVLRVLLIVLTMFGASAQRAWAQEQTQVMGRSAVVTAHRLHVRPSAEVSRQDVSARRTAESIMPLPSDREVNDEHFLGMPWLTIPYTPADRRVRVEHALRSGKYVASSLALLEPKEETRSTPSTTMRILDNYDTSVVAAVRFKF